MLVFPDIFYWQYQMYDVRMINLHKLKVFKAATFTCLKQEKTLICVIDLPFAYSIDSRNKFI